MTEINQPFTNVDIVSSTDDAGKLQVGSGGLYNIIQPSAQPGSSEFDRLNDTYWVGADFLEWQAGNQRWFYTFSGHPNRTLTAINTWVDGFRPSQVRINMNVGLGAVPATYDIFIVDTGANGIGSQAFSFTTANENIQHTFPITFGVDDIDFIYIAVQGATYTEAWFINEITFIS